MGGEAVVSGVFSLGGGGGSGGHVSESGLEVLEVVLGEEKKVLGGGAGVRHFQRRFGHVVRPFFLSPVDDLELGGGGEQ